MADEQVCMRLRYAESVLQFTNDVICYNRTNYTKAVHYTKPS